MARPGRCCAGISSERTTRSVSQPTIGAVRNDSTVATSAVNVPAKPVYWTCLVALFVLTMFPRSRC